MCQRKYALDIISEVGLSGAKPTGTPIEQNHQLALAEGVFLDDPEKYRRLVGRLIYLCFTWPELVYNVHVLSQFMQQPQVDHWEAALRVVRFLKGSLGRSIFWGTSAIYSSMDGVIRIGQVVHLRDGL